MESHWDDLRTKHTWNSIPENWHNLGHPPADTTIDLHIALKAQNENALIDALVDVSSLGHPKQGAHLSREEVAELVAPPSNCTPLPSQQNMAAVGRRSRPSLFPEPTNYYGLPAVLLEHVQSIAPTTRFPRTPRKETLMRRGGETTEQTKVPGEEPGTVLSSCDQYVTPSFLRWLYKTSRYVPSAMDRNVLGVIKGGGYNPSKPTSKANLNIQYTSAIAYPTAHIFYSTGSSGTLGRGDPFINWLDYVLGLWSVPQTVNTPYGIAEYKVLPDYDGFLPSFPSTCPWVTSVGGATGYDPEVAASPSGGGFSVYFPRAPYKNNAVPTFLLNLGGQYSRFYKCLIITLCNPGGRGIPDIALQEFDFLIILNRGTWTNAGTSCSTPTAAGIISLLNDYQISNGKAQLGFLNVLLYRRCLSGLNDITSGSNPGCNTGGFSAAPGFNAPSLSSFQILTKIIAVAVDIF
ncbi:subtilisin-like protein [Lactarius vividus]|nr:subtilisin-like protein [Lactarius vividus]